MHTIADREPGQFESVSKMSPVTSYSSRMQDVSYAPFVAAVASRRVKLARRRVTHAETVPHPRVPGGILKQTDNGLSERAAAVRVAGTLVRLEAGALDGTLRPHRVAPLVHAHDRRFGRDVLPQHDVRYAAILQAPFETRARPAPHGLDGATATARAGDANADARQARHVAAGGRDDRAGVRDDARTHGVGCG